VFKNYKDKFWNGKKLSQKSLKDVIFDIKIPGEKFILRKQQR